MIITVAKSANVRLDRPSVNSYNPSYLLKGDQVNAVKRVLGDLVNNDNEWILTENNHFITSAAFLSHEKINIPFDFKNINEASIFRKLEIFKLWDVLKSKGEGISVGIIDTGIAQIPSLNNKVIPVNYSFSASDDTESHGTYMASIIAAYDINNVRVGIAPLIKAIYSYKIVDLSPKEILKALKVLNSYDVNIINMSFSSNYNESDFKEVDYEINEMLKSNIIFISSTGNDSIQDRVYPAALNGVISVAGYNLSAPIKAWAGSNIWPDIDICAPYNRFFENSFNIKNIGTSVASAILTGILACSFNRIREKARNKIVSDYLRESLFPVFPKIAFLKNIIIPGYSTTEFLTNLKK